MLTDELEALAQALAATPPGLPGQDRIKATWRAAAFSEVSDRSLERYYNYHLAGISRLSDSLPEAAPAQGPLLELTDHLLAVHHTHLDDRLAASRAYQGRWSRQFVAVAAPLIAALKAGAISAGLRVCLTGILTGTGTSAAGACYTYRALSYLTRSTARLAAYLRDPSADETGLLDLLLELDLNHLDLFRYCQQRYLRTAAGLAKQERAAYFQRELARLRQQPVARHSYHPDWPPLPAMLAAFLREEMGLQHQVAQRDPDRKVALDLSVAQSACLLRALFEGGCFGEPNLQELFKGFARYFRTKRQEQVSAHSLSKEYYSIDQVTAAVIRDKLLRMVSWIDRNFFPVWIAVSVMIGAY